MPSLHVGQRAARALLAGLILTALSAPAPGQSLTPAATSPKKPASSSSKAPAKTQPASSSSAATSNPAPNPAAAPLVPPPERATAQADDAASSPHAPGDAPTENEMPNIVVSAATKNTQAPDTTATDTTVITQQELESARYQSVADALSKVPGVAVVPSGVPGQLTSVFIHGADSNQTLFTIDGRPQAAGLDGGYDFTNLTLDNVAQIEVVKTADSTTEGSATGGVINLVSLNGRGLDHPVSSVSFEGGSYDSFRENVQSRGSEGNFDYAVSATDWTSDMNRTNENYRNTTYRGNFGYQVTPTVYVDVHTGYSLASAGSPNTVESFDPTAHLTTQDWFISPEVSAKVTDFYTTKLYYSHDEQRQSYQDLYVGAYFPTQTRLDLSTDSYDWQNRFQLAQNWQITAGVQGSAQDANQIDYEDAAAEAAAFLTHANISNHLDDTGGYAQSQWQPLTGLNVITSARYDVYSDFSNAFSWRQGMTYEIAPTKTVVHASGSSSYTPPSAEDLYYPGSNNPSLKPESALSWEAGVAQPLLNGRLTPSATYFHNDITNYILFVSAANAPENIGQATTQGVELDLAAKPIDELNLDLNYTYLDAENDTSGVRLVRRPRNSLNFTIDYTPVKQLTLDLGGSWVMGRQDYDPVTFAQEAAPDYFVLRASATYQINQWVTLWVRGENLTDQSYEPVLGYPALGMAGYGGIKVSF
jgi:vitamin B12 transporter